MKSWHFEFPTLLGICITKPQQTKVVQERNNMALAHPFP